MSSASLTPRVRLLAVCDRVRPSKTEADVFSLRGVRYQVVAEAFPHVRRLHVFLILSSPRRGRFPGYVKVIDDQHDRAIFYGQIDPAPTFPQDGDLLPLDLSVRVR